MTLKFAMLATRNMGLRLEWEKGFNRSAHDLAPLCEHICFPGMTFADLAGVTYADFGNIYERPGNGGKSPPALCMRSQTLLVPVTRVLHFTRLLKANVDGDGIAPQALPKRTCGFCATMSVPGCDGSVQFRAKQKTQY